MLLRRLVGDERGGVLALVALAMVGVLGAVGLALDSGRGYVRRAELTRAVDASSLSAARALRKGRTTAEATGGPSPQPTASTPPYCPSPSAKNREAIKRYP